MKRLGNDHRPRIALAGALALFLAVAGCGGGGGGGTTASTPPPVVPGNVPQNVSAAARAGSITVSWSPVAGATSYNVYWSTSPNVTKQNGTLIGNATSPYVQAGLTGGTIRYYVATCIVGGAEGPDSAVATATIDATLVAGPDVGQYFDRGFQAAGAQNYDDRSSHPLRGLTTPDTTLLFGGKNCLDCHYVSGPARTSDECLKCHFENQPNAPGNHWNGILELATVNRNSLPTSRFTINTIQDYDAWCLQCHQGTATSLGNVFPSAARKTVVDPAAFANGRHRWQNPPVGCIYCHHPHGRSNTMLVRENPDLRRSALAGPAPALFGVFPNDALNGTAFGPAQDVPYRSRPYWADNTQPYLPEADDDQAYCNKACHVAKYSGNFVKDKMILRAESTGNYITGPSPRYLKIYLVNGFQYTIDNLPMLANRHGHVNGEIITTDNMVRDYANLIGLTGPTYYYYPLPGGSSNPSTYDPSLSSLPFRPDFADGNRDFANAWNGLGVRITYRFTCSTCHDPHGNGFLNSPGGSGYPDLRLPRTNPDTLCRQCH